MTGPFFLKRRKRILINEPGGGRGGRGRSILSCLVVLCGRVHRGVGSAACGSDPTPIVQDTSADGVGGRDTGYRLGANDRVRIIVFGQPTLTGE